MQRLGGIQQLSYDVCGKRVSELRNNIQLVVLAERRDETVDGLLDLRSERFNCGGRETLVHEFAKACVLRGIEEKHPEAERVGEFRKLLLLIGGKLVNRC